MTRQFNIDPRLMCRQHLLGEHSEMHEGVGLIESPNTVPTTVAAQLEGQARNGNIDTSWFKPRHDALVIEMQLRGYNHESPLEYDDELAIGDGAVDPDESVGVLMKCEDCRPRILLAFKDLDRADMEQNARGKPITPTKWYPDADHPFDQKLEAVVEAMGDRPMPEA